MTQTHTDVSQKILDSMQSLSIDNAEIKNTLKHIDNKFDRVNDDLKDVKSIALKAAADADEVKSDNRLINTRVTELEKDSDRLFEKFRERDRKSDADKKWLVATIISTIVMLIGFVTFLINYFI